MPVDLSGTISKWRERLLDLTKRNRLISYRLGGAGGVGLEYPDIRRVWQTLVVDGDTLMFPWKSDLLHQDDEVGSGAADEEHASPLFQRNGDGGGGDGQSDVAGKEGAADPDDLEACKRSADFGDNDVLTRLADKILAQAMSENFDIALPAAEDSLLEGVGALDDFLQAVRQAVSQHTRWSVLEVTVLGNFSFQKVAMWTDLGNNQRRIGEHPLCRALAGEPLADMGLVGIPSAATLDDVVRPQDTFHILDADSSQHEAIEAVKNGRIRSCS